MALVAAAPPAIGDTADYVLFGMDGGNDDDWTQMMVSAVMPEGAASTKIQLIHILEISTTDTGAIYLDDASLTVTAVPVPATVWLFGSGLLCLIGIASKKAA